MIQPFHQTPSDKSDAPSPTDHLFRELEEKDKAIRDLQEKIEGMIGQMQAQEKELVSANLKVQEMAETHAAMEKQLDTAVLQAKVQAEDLERAKEKATQKKEEGKGNVVKVQTVQQEKLVEKVVVDDAALLAAKKELEKHLEIENDLREANR